MPTTEDVGEREVSWAVTARAAAPMLNPLRGGELVLLPDRVLSESGLALPVLLRELAGHHVSAAVVETPPAVAATIPVLVAPNLTPEFETDLNRMLTERRGELYRSGTEIGRLLAGGEQTAHLGTLVRTAGAFLRCPVAVMSPRGTVLERTGEGAVPSGGSRAALTMTGPREWRDRRYLVKLPSGDVLWIGPVSPDNRALVRLAADRIALAVETALQRSIDVRPRGAARSAALNNLLQGSADDAERNGAMLGLAPDATFRVLLACPESDAAALQRSLHSSGEVHDAGAIDGLPAFVLHQRADTDRIRAGTGREPGEWTPGAGENDWLAMSGCVHGPGQLPEACRQARYVAALIKAGAVPSGVALFDRLSDVGVYRLLYGLWGSPALSSYIEDALGDLGAHDRRGTLRQTFRAYLDAGGSLTETAHTLGIHRNTLAYRLRQIASLTGRDPADPGMRLVMHLALVGERLPPGQ
jgi:purine catabolism regulator